MKAITQTILGGQQPNNTVTWLPCRVVTVSPLVIDFYSAATYPASKLAGTTLTVGPALALMMSPNQPLVMQIG